MSSDTSRVSMLFNIFHLLWSTPFQIILILYLLFRTIGYAAFGGFLVMVISIPINISLTRLARSSFREVVKSKDTRIKYIVELITNIKLIKMFSWEEPMKKKINDVRNDQELHALKNYGYLGSLVNFVISLTPNFVSLSTLAIYAVFDNKTHGPLNAQLIFVTLSLLNNLRFSLTRAPMVLSSVIEIFYSIERLENFFNQPEFDKASIISYNDKKNKINPSNSSNDLNSTESQSLLFHTENYNSISEPGSSKISIDSNCSIMMDKAEFNWDKESNFNLFLDFKLNKGECVGILGSIGSGKSSLISAIVGEMNKESGQVIVNGSVSYAPQVPWIMNASLRENIIFGTPYNKEFYDSIIEACELVLDISLLPAGDQTEIGERGVNLSGGQKARVSMARAIYSKPDIILLDDTLSALDATIGKRVFDRVIGPNGLLHNATRIIVTHSMQYLNSFDRILILKEGKLIANSKFSKEVDSILKDMKFLKTDDTYIEADLIKPKNENKLLQSREVLPQTNPENNTAKSYKLLTVEESQTSSVQWSTYKSFIKSCGLWSVFFIAITLLLNSTFGVLANYTLKVWSDFNDSNLPPSEKPSSILFLSIYALFGVLAAFSSSLASLLIRSVCAINAAKKTHSKMLDSVIKSPMSFFYTTPLGRIINRFSSDQNTIDQVLPGGLMTWASAMLSSISSIIVISLSFPEFTILSLPLIVSYLVIQEYYLQTSRQLKRISSIMQSPIYAHFTESVVGISTIRSFKQQNRFMMDNELKLSKYLSASLTFSSLSSWKSIRIESLGSFIVLFASTLGVVYIQMFGRIDASLAALSIVYSLQFTNSLSRSVEAYCGIETNIISVERVYEYTNLPSEFKETPETIIQKSKSPEMSGEWPLNGNIIADDLTVRYFPDLGPALSKVSFKINSGEKIGVVGRTGSGKSTLASSLFRLIEPESGNISIDNLNIRSVELAQLRNSISIIPQESILIAGTLRYNLDPTDKYTDEELWKVIELVNLKEIVNSRSSGLEMKILNDGGNFSTGQRQLICLARVILKKSKVLILDEATASVDLATESTILNAVEHEFSGCTVISIAHRLETVIKCDKILYFEKGNLLEAGNPSVLLNNENSKFYQLYHSH
ncbi:Multidrug resistance-associated protein 1 [Smittium culicis]|uniref:Multidrug resistance-associated protein 1 n=1 Tax=Smittium culicis TaxID=133412 RepID=A0A1R1XDK5_9FUNG|nr:Multidrug resistance-associated protein 1 [Smittium culicis]